MSLRRALAPEGDSVIFQDRVIHVASWASKFLFTGEQLGQPVEKLSGGERARVLIAQLMLQPADILLLDEPTNDLDIPTLEILEESLLEFRGSLVLVTHDRYLLDRVSTVLLGLDGQGEVESFADYAQWESWQAERMRSAKETASPPSSAPISSKPRSQMPKKLSYMEAREYAGIEQRVAEAEHVLSSKQAEMENPAIASDGPKLIAAHAEWNRRKKIWTRFTNAGLNSKKRLAASRVSNPHATGAVQFKRKDGATAGQASRFIPDIDCKKELREGHGQILVGRYQIV